MSSYLIELERLRAELVDILRAKGKTVSSDAPLNELVHLVHGIGINSTIASLLIKEREFEIVDDEGVITELRGTMLQGSYVTKLILPHLSQISVQSALKNTSRLQTAEFGTAVPSCLINSFTFDGGSGLQTFIGGNCTVNDAAFRNCSNLIIAKFQSINITYNNTFGNNTSLRIADLGYTNSLPNRMTFDGCTSFKALVLRKDGGIVSLAGANFLSYLVNNVSGWYIYVPEALVDTYKADSRWSTYADYLKPLSEYNEEEILNGGGE